MKKALLIGLAAAMLSTAAPVTQMAQAHPAHHYRGGCTFETINDTLPTEPLGGQNQWTGEATAAIIATNTDTDPSPDINNSTPTPTDSITFECTLWRNGTTNLGVILSGTGTGVATDTQAPFTFTAGETDTIQVCEEVTVAGEQHGDSSTFNSAWCTDSTRTPIVPEPITEALTLIVSTLNSLVFTLLDSLIICPILLALRPVVNTLDPTIVFIHPDGDLDLFETPFWDCPPYGPDILAEPALFVALDLDGDGDLEGVTSDPTQAKGDWTTVGPELTDASFCNTLPEPARTICRNLISTTYLAGTQGHATGLAGIHIADTDGDLADGNPSEGEYEAVVSGVPPAGTVAADVDNDGDDDIVWT